MCLYVAFFLLQSTFFSYLKPILFLMKKEGVHKGEAINSRSQA